MKHDENYRLVKPSLDLKSEFVNMAVEYRRFGDNRYQKWLENFEEYFERLEDLANSKDLSAKTVSSSTFFLMSQDKMIGRSALRHELNPELEIKGGHIGYDIRPRKRHKGLGTLILKLTLEKARRIGLEKVLITCDTDNVGSIKIIEKNGGILDKQIIYEETGTPISHYWVKL